MTAAALTVSAVALLSVGGAHAQAPIGPEGCRAGFVFRDAVPGDRVCVEPTAREQAQRDNAAAESRRAETAFGQPGCADGFVLRELTPDDKVCVTPAVRDQIVADNATASERSGTGAPVTPAPGMSPQLTQAIRQAFLTWARTNSVTNASLVVMQNAQFANATGEGAWTADTIVPVASLSKAITGACVMTLVDNRRLNFDSTLQVVAPNLTASLQPAFQFNAASIRIGHLLRHASGLSVQSTQGASFGTGAAAANPALWYAQTSLNATLASSPGTRYLYNNTNFAILELVIAEVTGESYETYCKRTVLTPRGAPNARIGAGVRAMGAWGGWEISAREYANFYAWSFDPRSLAMLSRTGHDFLTTRPVSGFEIPGCTGCNYALGLIVVLTGRPALPLGPARNTFHHGDWTSSLTTPTTFAAFAATWDNGFTVVVTYDRFVSNAAQVDLDNQLRDAAYRRDL